jgi:hypothetical protein
MAGLVSGMGTGGMASLQPVMTEHVKTAAATDAKPPGRLDLFSVVAFFIARDC